MNQIFSLGNFSKLLLSAVAAAMPPEEKRNVGYHYRVVSLQRDIWISISLPIPVPKKAASA